MKTLFFDCGMGAAGDMIVAALTELTDNPDETVNELNALNIPGTVFVKEKTEKCGITGTHIRVLVNDQEEDEHMHDHHHEHGHDHHHHHSSMHSIEHIVNDHITISDKVRKDILAVYGRIAEAESTVHNTDIENIHFHEVGTMDAVADITAACYLMDKLKIDEVYASPIHVGKGTVKCAHGILPVPAPATALILKGVPVYSKEEINGELCTPTGAALLKHFVREFRDMPTMTIEKIGYGMGTKDFPVANCLRVILGESVLSMQGIVRELDFNVDDMTGEEIGYVTEQLLAKGAFEVFVTPVYMKKNRPGHLVTVLCSEANESEMVKLIFTLTTTLGIRETVKNRFVLNRKIETVETEFGLIRKKVSDGYGVRKEKYEYDDISGIASEKGMSIREVTGMIQKKHE